MRYLFLLIALLCLAVTPATASPVNCLSVLGANVLSLTEGCYLPGYVFDEFSVRGTPDPPGSMVFLSPNGTLFNGCWAHLGFDIVAPDPPSETIFEYRVTGYVHEAGIYLDDYSWNMLNIQEIVCAVAFTNGVCPAESVLGDINGGWWRSAGFRPQTQVWIQDELLLDESTPSAGHFRNLYHQLPEPMSFLLVGAGLAGTVLLRRRVGLRPK